MSRRTTKQRRAARARRAAYRPAECRLANARRVRLLTWAVEAFVPGWRAFTVGAPGTYAGGTP